MYTTEQYLQYFLTKCPQSGSGLLPAIGTALSVANKFCDLIDYVTPGSQKQSDVHNSSTNEDAQTKRSHKRKKIQTVKKSHRLVKRFKKV